MGKTISQEEFIKNSIIKHGNKYDYSKIEYKTIRDKVNIICPIHGEFSIMANRHTSSGDGCPTCKKEILLKENSKNFFKKAKKIHGDKYDYSKFEYTGCRKKSIIICPTHGEFLMTPIKHISDKCGCKKCNYDSKRLSRGDIINRFKDIHGNKYDYSEFVYKGFHKKSTIICSIHGRFEQSSASHLSGCGCYECGKQKTIDYHFKDIETFLKKAYTVHGDKYDYSKSIYNGIQNDIEIICKIHGGFFQNAGNHIHNATGCPKCSNNISKNENYLENFLKKNKINYKRGDREQINPLELDFYLPDHNIAIEVNGVHWHSQLKGKDKNYHLNKTNLCKEKGIKLIHINENEFVNSLPIIKSKLNSILGINKRKIYGRKCIVKEIDTKLKSKFLRKYHLQGDDKASVRLGLFYKDRLVSVMTFCKRRVALGKKSSNEGEYELSRYCGNFNFYVIGGASKLLKYFERNYNPTKIVTYADKRWSTGDLYFKLGFTHTHDSKPNYWYFKNGKCGNYKLYHRFNFRKSELPKKLETFDLNKTEWENMVENNWNRIWDCGNMVFEKNK